MKRSYIRFYFLICLALAISLFIYLFYRTEKTIINELLIQLISVEKYSDIKTYISSLIPLKEFEIYSLPQGLWVFCTALTSKHFYLKFFDQKINLSYLPIVLAVVIELIQLLHWTDGRFDPIDLLFSVIFWVFGTYIFKSPYQKDNIFPITNLRSLSCIFCYSIVFLGCVW